MNAAHLHLSLNHFPVLGTVFGLVLAIAATRRRSRDLEAAALWVFVVTAMVAVPVYLTGEAAEEIAESLPGVTESHIEPHEEAALFSLIAAEALGIVAFAGLVLGRGGRTAPRWPLVTALIASLITAALMAWTANLGGQIRHTEIRSASVDTPRFDQRQPRSTTTSRDEPTRESHHAASQRSRARDSGDGSERMVSDFQRRLSDDVFRGVAALHHCPPRTSHLLFVKGVRRNERAATVWWRRPLRSLSALRAASL